MIEQVRAYDGKEHFEMEMGDFTQLPQFPRPNWDKQEDEQEEAEVDDLSTSNRIDWNARSMGMDVDGAPRYDLSYQSMR